MASSTRTPKSSLGSRLIPVGSLSPDSFAPFGQVIQNPATHAGAPKLEHAVANQGTATKWLDVTNMTGYYDLGPSRKLGQCVLNMFVCKPRELIKRNGREMFDVKILERHPYTPQTFVPMGLESHDKETFYLVIVAPTLPSRSWDDTTSRRPPYPTELPQQPRRSLKDILLGARPNPFTNDYAPITTPPPPSRGAAQSKPKGPGPPDLENLQAFIARGDQAVTYGPGTWHAPMVVLGAKPIEFVVVQYANGVALEDCQEFEIDSARGSLSVDLSEGLENTEQPKAKL